jgi:hypothetical protein
MKRGLRYLREKFLPDADINSVLKFSAEDKRAIGRFYDDSVPLPQDATARLRWDHPELVSLRKRYAALGWPVCSHVQWSGGSQDWIRKTFMYFRGETPYVWQYRELPKITRLKFFIFLRYVLSQDRVNLVERLGEDGAFGCWRYVYQGHPAVSRDLLDSVLELSYLDRQVSLFSKKEFKVLDIGAGYGRVAHRMLEACPGISDYACVDAIAESSYLCRYYLEHRGLLGRARVVPLDQVPDQLKPDHFDLAINIHSFSECTFAAVQWWIDRVVKLRIPYFLIIPNDPERLLTNEGQGVKRDFLPLLEAAGYKLQHREPVFTDAGVREVLGIGDQFFLFAREA